MIIVPWEMTFIYFMGFVLPFTTHNFVFMLVITGKLRFTAKIVYVCQNINSYNVCKIYNYENEYYIILF